MCSLLLLHPCGWGAGRGIPALPPAPCCYSETPGTTIWVQPVGFVPKKQKDGLHTQGTALRDLLQHPAPSWWLDGGVPPAVLSQSSYICPLQTHLGL